MHSHQAHLTIIATLFLQLVPGLLARRHDGFRHEVEVIDRRQAVTAPLYTVLANSTVSNQCLTPSTTSPPIITIITPSPGAEPVEITAQSQVVESFIPAMAFCAGPPLRFKATATLTGAPYPNGTTLYAQIVDGTGSCTTSYVSTSTTVCATVLTGLASKVTISECDQEVTFSSECGFALETPSPTTADNSIVITPAPTVKQLMTYYLAPWQSLTLGETPSDVDIKVCTVLGEDKLECRRYQEVWEVVVLTSTITTEREVQISTTVTGPGTLVVETFQSKVTDTVVFFDLTTTLHLEAEIEIETTSKRRKFVTGPEDESQSTSTMYLTKTVKYKSATTWPEPETTVRVTSTRTLVVGTITKTRPTQLTRPTL